jgi:hypothetical protein
MERDEDTAGEATVEMVAGTHMEEVVLCPGCGLPQSAWPIDEEGESGYPAPDDTTFCCAGCAEETGCTCRGEAG